jgi:hypothetical protein
MLPFGLYASEVVFHLYLNFRHFLRAAKLVNVNQLIANLLGCGNQDEASLLLGDPEKQ